MFDNEYKSDSTWTHIGSGGGGGGGGGRGVLGLGGGGGGWYLGGGFTGFGGLGFGTTLTFLGLWKNVLKRLTWSQTVSMNWSRAR